MDGGNYLSVRPPRCSYDAAVTHLLDQYGLILLFAVVALESFGLPLPGETALIAAAVLAQRGHFDIVAVIAVAAVAAIVGDNLGYWAGRKGGRRLLERAPILRRYTPKLLPTAERFFHKHGSKTVFIARFVSVLRVTAAWMAGISHMNWWTFLAWNAAGGIVWATLVGTLSYYFGRALADAIAHYGAIGALVLVALVAVVLVGVHVLRKRMEA
jgi:membrane protein DedA with SNARE-associated domain